MSDLKLSDWDRQLYQERLINFTIFSQKVRMENNKKPQKKFEVTCNQGSLSGGSSGREIKIIIEAVNIEAARLKFHNDQENMMYGRQIKTIREV